MINENMLLSIIIPAFNAAPYLRRCLDNIYLFPLNEEDYEIIVIDDCSTDDTLKILYEYAEIHTNLRLFHQLKNMRQGSARNIGIDSAKGNYITFCDADDYLVADGVMNALHAVEKSFVDVCYFGMEYQNKDSLWHLVVMPQETHNTILPSVEYLNKYYTCEYNGPVRCLYKTKFLRCTGIRFVEGVRWEDCDWTVKVYAKAKEIQFVDGVGYRYVWNGNSTSRQFDAQAMSEQLMAGVRLIQFSKEIEIDLPGLSKTLYEEAKFRYVIQNIRLRNLTKYKVVHVYTLYKTLSKNYWIFLETIQLPIWEYIVVKHHYLALAFLCFACPVSALVRKILDIKRKVIYDTKNYPLLLDKWRSLSRKN